MRITRTLAASVVAAALVAPAAQAAPIDAYTPGTDSGLPWRRRPRHRAGDRRPVVRRLGRRVRFGAAGVAAVRHRRGLRRR